MTFEEMKQWITNTDAKLTFIGPEIHALSVRAPNAITVTWCTQRSQNVCGGTCTVFTGTSACLDTAGCSCLSATANVAFCDRSGCGHSCNEFDSCGTRLDNNFCYTPGTASISVPPS